MATKGAASTDSHVSPLKTAFLLLLWGFASSWTDTLNKAILNRFDFPITLTLSQFALSALIGFVALPVAGVKPYQNGKLVSSCHLVVLSVFRARDSGWAHSVSVVDDRS